MPATKHTSLPTRCAPKPALCDRPLITPEQAAELIAVLERDHEFTLAQLAFSLSSSLGRAETPRKRLAIVADSPTHKVFPDRRIHPVRDPDPGELYAVHELRVGQPVLARAGIDALDP